MKVRRGRVLWIAVPIMAVGLGVLLTTGLLSGQRAGSDRPGAATTSGGGGTATAGTATAAPAATGPGGPATGYLDQATRRATVSGVSMVLPGDPYRVSPDPIAIGGVLDVCFLAEATVHPRTHDTPGWGAMVGLAHIDRRLAPAGKTDALRTITGHFFGSHETTLSKVSTEAVTVAGRPAKKVVANVDYTVPGLASTHDVVTAIVLTLEGGDTVIAIASVPDDAPDEVGRRAAESLATLTVD